MGEKKTKTNDFVNQLLQPLPPPTTYYGSVYYLPSTAASTLIVARHLTQDWVFDFRTSLKSVKSKDSKFSDTTIYLRTSAALQGYIEGPY